MIEPASPEPTKPPSLEPLTSEFRVKPSRQIPTILFCLAILVALGFIFSGRIKFTGGPATPEEQTTALKKSAETSAEFGALADQRTVQVSWKRLKRQLESGIAEHKVLAEAIETLAQKLTELRRSDAGRRVAADEALIEQFAAIEHQSRPKSGELHAWKQDLQDLIEICDRALQDSTLLLEPNEKLTEQSTTACREVSEALRQAEADLTGVASLVRRSAGNKPVSVTLADSVATREQDREERRLTDLAKKREAIRNAANEQKEASELAAERRLREQELEQQRIENESKVTQAKAKTDREQAVLRDTQEKLVEEKAHAEKLKKFEKALPEIRTLLAPMISKGKMQIGGGGWIPGEEGPVSLASLKRNKTLELTEIGLISLGSLFCKGRNDRPQGGFPEVMPYSEVKIRRAQELLVEFGDILVEKKMLRP